MYSSADFNKKMISIVLSILLGSVFIISAATKIYPMEPFEYQFVDIGIATWKTAPYFARFFIGLEFFLGMMLILNIKLRKFTLKFAIVLLLVFNIYLIYKVIVDGNKGNCGCFGEVLQMTPLQAIIKNIILIILAIIVYLLTNSLPFTEIPILISTKLDGFFEKLQHKTWMSISKKIFIFFLYITSMCLGFFIYPIDIVFSTTLDHKTINYKVPLELMYSSSQQEKPTIDLTKGKHIIAFLSLTCPHCKIAAQKMNIMHKKNPVIPFYFVLNGDNKLLTEFLTYTNTKNIAHNLFNGANDWMKVAGFSLPIIMYIDNSIVQKKCNGIELSQDDIENWLNK